MGDQIAEGTFEPGAAHWFSVRHTIHANPPRIISVQTSLERKLSAICHAKCNRIIFSMLNAIFHCHFSNFIQVIHLILFLLYLGHILNDLLNFFLTTIKQLL